MRLKQTKAIQSNFSTQCDDWYIFGVIGLEIVKNASNHAVFLKSVMKTKFRDRQCSKNIHIVFNKLPH